METWSCVLVGEGPLLVAVCDQVLELGGTIEGVVSRCERVEAWCRGKAVLRVEPQDGWYTRFSEARPDYLFSVVNHQILAPEVVQLPTQAAINYHDSLLPEYAGFNATSWAIIDGKNEHGITWHLMSNQVDGGQILHQEKFEILPDDTAFTLTTKCGRAAVQSFPSLMRGLRRGTIAGAPAVQPSSFHLRSERLGLGLLDFEQSGEVISRLVRGLDFGPEANWMCTPKVCTASGAVFRVERATFVPGPQTIRVGEVVQWVGASVQIAVPDGVVQLEEFSDFAGKKPDVDELIQSGLRPGGQLVFGNGAYPALADYDKRATRSERYWQRRLAEFESVQLSELNRASSEMPAQVTRTSVAASFEEMPVAMRRAHLLASLIVYLKRAVSSKGLVQLGLLVPSMPDEAEKFYSQVVPLVIPVSDEELYRTLVQRTGDELTQTETRLTFARDIFLRYQDLRGKPQFDGELPVLVSLGAVPTALQGICLNLDAAGIELHYHPEALRSDQAQLLTERLALILTEGLDRADTVWTTLSIIPDAERNLLVDQWQHTKVEYPFEKCVHQYFEDQVRRSPQATALVSQGQSVSYLELDQRAHAVAVELVRLGLRPDDLVGVCVQRSIEIVVALLGVLKAGAAYVPIDPAYPAERLECMIEDSKAKVVLTQAGLASRLPKGQKILLIESCPRASDESLNVEVHSSHLAYVIFTSGSTGRPKGVMVEHRNVGNFFAGMDDVLGTEPGVWLALTSISFDISVLEIFWTLGRGYKVVLQDEGDRASLLAEEKGDAGPGEMGFGLFYFAADSTDASSRDAYRLLKEGARFADTHGFTAVWTPERHFHAFGGLYPNAAVTSASIAVLTENIEIRAGSVVLPLHDPIRVAEDWAVVDNLSGGRVGLSFASGWHANDFALMPNNYERRREIMHESIATVLRLWSGEKITAKNGEGKEVELSILPKPVRARPPMWIASAGSVETFEIAGRNGHNVLTNMLGQDLAGLKLKFEAYRKARKDAGFEGPGIVSVMLHTFVCGDDEEARNIARAPFCAYMESSYDLVKVAPWMFPAFKQPSQGGGQGAFDPTTFDDEDMRALLEHAFDRYFETAGLFGTPERALKMVSALKRIGANEVACLVDFGIDPEVVLANLPHLNRLRELANVASTETRPSASIAEQIQEHAVTHIQCTPSHARMMLSDGSAEAMRSLKILLLGGEALSSDLARKLRPHLSGRIINMYGPTETTVWSTTSEVKVDEGITIGRPIANTVIRILDEQRRLCPVGTAGELYIGGDGVTRGYLGRDDLTSERFVQDQYGSGDRLYRTGDLARFLVDGQLEYLGRIDQQIKLNGYRIELGEIETVLSRHPAVRESVVAVKKQGEHLIMVGYIVPQGAKESGDSLELEGWGKRWNEAYSRRVGIEEVQPRFDTSGWLSSFTGTPLSQSEMKEWLHQTAERVLASAPTSVLELGCGTGMVLFSCLPHVNRYVGLDLSEHAISTIYHELTASERAKVALHRSAAHQLDVLGEEHFDLVVINSVAQYFPDTNYLRTVLNEAKKRLSPGGRIFLGDIRGFDQLRLFHTLVEVEQASGQSSFAVLNRRIDERSESEPELLVAPGLFSDGANWLDGLFLDSLTLKTTPSDNEMSLFRYDVVLASVRPEELDFNAVPQLSNPSALEISQALDANPEYLFVNNVSNLRLAPVLEMTQRLMSGEAGDANELRAVLERHAASQSTSAGLRPEQLVSLNSDYQVEVRWRDGGAELEVLFRSKSAQASATWPLTETSERPLSNVPAKRGKNENWNVELRKHLTEFLPLYMIPSTFLELEAFPLTPNGKIDRNALPEPGVESKPPTVAEFVLASNDLESKIASIWQTLLGVQRVGMKDNIFDLGASSLMTVEANNLLQSALGRKIPLVNMFRYPTIEKLAAHLGVSSAPAAVSTEIEGTGKSKEDRIKAAAERRRAARARTET